MKNVIGIIFVLLSVCLLTVCRSESNIKSLSKKEIYFFYQETCPHCHTAAQYIKDKYPQLKINSRDIKLPGNWALFKEAVQTYEIRGRAGTPLICFGEHYIMGWGLKDSDVFDYYVQPYLKK